MGQVLSFRKSNNDNKPQIPQRKARALVVVVLVFIVILSRMGSANGTQFPLSEIYLLFVVGAGAALAVFVIRKFERN